MLFVLIGWDTPQSRIRRPTARQAHLEHWKDLDEAGRIVIAGPMTDYSGSLMIVEFESEEEARRKMEADPYLASGVFERVELHPFKGVLPTKQFGEP